MTVERPLLDRIYIIYTISFKRDDATAAMDATERQHPSPRMNTDKTRIPHRLWPPTALLAQFVAGQSLQDGHGNTPTSLSSREHPPLSSVIPPLPSVILSEVERSHSDEAPNLRLKTPQNMAVFTRFNRRCSSVVEQRIRNAWVVSSILTTGSKSLPLEVCQLSRIR